MSNVQPIKEDVQLDPIRPAEFGAVQHKVRQFSAQVSGNLTKEDLETPALWSLVAKHLSAGDSEVRCIADDMSFIAYGIVTYAQGTTAKIKITSFHKLDDVNPDEVVDPLDDYIIKMRGQEKWCVMRKSTGEVIKKGIATQAEALKELDEYKRVLSS